MCSARVTQHGPQREGWPGRRQSHWVTSRAPEHPKVAVGRRGDTRRVEVPPWLSDMGLGRVLEPFPTLSGGWDGRSAGRIPASEHGRTEHRAAARRCLERAFTTLYRAFVRATSAINGLRACSQWVQVAANRSETEMKPGATRSRERPPRTISTNSSWPTATIMLVSTRPSRMTEKP